MPGKFLAGANDFYGSPELPVRPPGVIAPEQARFSPFVLEHGEHRSLDRCELERHAALAQGLPSRQIATSKVFEPAVCFVALTSGAKIIAGLRGVEFFPADAWIRERGRERAAAMQTREHRLVDARAG